MAETTTGTNGQSNAQAPNKLKDLHAVWVKNGSKPALPAENKKLVAEYIKADKEYEAAQKAVLAAQTKRSAAVEAIIIANGKGRLRIGGDVHVPMSRGDTVFFRVEGTGEVKDIG